MQKNILFIMNISDAINTFNQYMYVCNLLFDDINLLHLLFEYYNYSYIYDCSCPSRDHTDCFTQNFTIPSKLKIRLLTINSPINLKYLQNINILSCLEYLKLTTLSDTLDGIQQFKKLRILYCCNNNIFSLNGIQHLQHLNELVCCNNKIISLNYLQYCTKLNILYCSNNNLYSLHGLHELYDIKTIYCSNNNITTLASISKLDNLKKLYCANNQIKSLMPLQNMRNIETLDCYNNKIKNYDFLHNIKHTIFYFNQ